MEPFVVAVGNGSEERFADAAATAAAAQNQDLPANSSARTR